MPETLDGPRWGPAEGGAPRKLVVLLHGLGADGFDLIDLAPGWGKAVPDALFLAPHAPEPCDLAPYGRQWFSVQDRTPARMLAGVQVAAAHLDAFLDAETARLGLSAGDVALMGFSQGAMTALFTGLRRDPPPAAILAYSGRLLGAEGLAARPPVLLVHGEADEVVPVSGSRDAEAALRAAGVPVEAAYRPGLGHGLDDAGIALGGLMLQQHLGAAA
ncbi:phospholipase [Falsiroseomonas bella]|uniref:Phospholipase n=1 Tax=Falsiroseomonas bella TaxID=2184016 RepID=A0A317FDC8_9PROT|nr:prolyl oligopeptidase family serine peptidase [Falsiroseomonas bella]PWS35546.1 phospholipase [Falsiroseomonas bella]